ncbi:hypothetical protein K1T71_008209 [Dendrolimus kikuchii]|uniref:Uncharacterized protein n=1 Tax=Dendrolimus kikuchii TaxID=765133 RepID=A0ACC1CWV5_9NEOP|nr:hypothetical protein K1T71_008209 [Dendrolimus kikuchii]
MYLFAKKNYQHFTIFVAVILFEESSGCFQSDEYQNSSVKTDSSFYVECECTDYHDGVETLKWLDKDNKIIEEGPGTESNLIYIERLPNSANLHIPSVTKSMSGTYKCVAQHDGKEYVHTHNLHVYDPLTFFNTSDIQYVLEGTESKVICEVRSDSRPMIGWYKDETEVSGYTDKYKVVLGGLIIHNVVKEDAGTYRCNVLTEETSEEIDKYIKVEVLTIPVITNLEAIPDKIVRVGENIIVECKADGAPEPEYKFSKNSAMEPDENKNVTWIQEGNRIVFSEIQVNDAGCYECFAFNLVGNNSKEIIIEVFAPPVVTSFLDITAVEGASVLITCSASGKPKPNISITFESSSDKNNGDSQEIQNNSLLKIERSHAGVYVCNASNEIAFDTKSMYLTVLHKPYFETLEEEIWGWIDKTISISCEHDSNPKSLRTWRFKGSPQGKQLFAGKSLIHQLSNSTKNYLAVTIGQDFPYGIFECDVRNEYGNATKIIKIKQAFAPPVIINASLREISATSATFSIEGPINVEGPPVTGFEAEYDSLENYKIVSVYQKRSWAIDRPYKITSLKPNTTYSIKFAAINAVGPGVWSNYTEFKTLEKSAPEPPLWEDDYIQTSPNGNIELQWRAPESNGEPIDYYSIRYCPSNENIENEIVNLPACVEERLEPTTKLDLSRLQPNISYHFELVAHNAEGNSTAATITVTVPELQILQPVLSAGAIIGIAIAVVFICLLLLDLLFLFWRKQGILASCFVKKNKKKNDEKLNIRDKKGLLKDGADSTDTLRRPNNGHKEYEYNKTTGVITGKHSSV